MSTMLRWTVLRWVLAGCSGLAAAARSSAPTAAGSGRGPMIQRKASGVRGPGDYPLSVQSTWLSIVARDGRHSEVTAGRRSFSRPDWRGSPVGAGAVKLSAGAITGERTFALPMTVLDIGTMRQRAGTPAR